MMLRAVGRTLLLVAALTAVSCGDSSGDSPSGVTPSTPRTARQEVRSTNKVLILGSSVAGGLSSREATAVHAMVPTAQIDVVTPAQWSALTATQFMSYRALIIGDAACDSGTASFQAAIDNRFTWGAIVDGDVALLATNPTSNATDMLVENGIRFVLNSLQYTTGMYVSLGCAYQSAPANTPVPLLEPFGTFLVEGLPTCADSGHMFEMNNDFLSRDLWDGLLGGAGGCAAHSVFTTYPEHTFSFATLAMNSSAAPVPGQKSFTDYTYDPGNETVFEGTPYILVRGAMTLGAGCGLPAGGTQEECDLGDGLNGSPANDGQFPRDTCSWSCHLQWCGDGYVDTQFGEECDNGANNGRVNDPNAEIGTCTSFCKFPKIPQNRPPVALCMDVTLMATNTCGLAADVNNGSFDPDNDLVGCTPSPAGPYGIGNTPVTLTCTDRANNTATCTGLVTVLDKGPPTVTLTPPLNQSLECTKNATYTDPGYSASDLCEGPLPLSSVARTGSVSMGVPSSYSLSYQATDSAGNTSAIVTRSVTVADTLPPTLTRIGGDVTRECGTSFMEPGITATDQCDGTLTNKIIRTGIVNTAEVGDYVLHYNVKDAANHPAAEVTRTVFIRDRIAPTVTLNAPASQTAECGSAYSDPSATAIDSCVGTLPVVVNTSTVNMNLPGSYTLNYRATDPSGNVGISPNRAVTVSDTLAPTLVLNGSATMTLECAAAFIDPYAAAIDQCYGSLTSQIVETGTVNTQAPGSYTLTYNVTDPSGLAAPAVTRTVAVRDTLPPIITMNGPSSQSLECGSTYTDPGATALDACAGTVPAVATTSANPGSPGSYLITYTATDPSGNKITLYGARTVTVSDTLPPTLVLNGPASLALECGSPYTDAGATANDACFGDITSRITRTGSVSPGTPGSYTVTYNVSDPAGLSAPPVSRTVSVADTLPPVLTVLGSPSLQQECGTPYTDAGATAVDVCAGTLPVTTTGSVNSAAVGNYTLSYSASDSAGHTVTGSRSVAVKDTLPPQIEIIPGPSVLPCNGSPYVDPGATATDLCAGNLTSSIVTTTNLDQTRAGQYTVTYSVSDGAGHTSAVFRPLTVQGTQLHLSDFNLFLLEDYTGGHDVQGKIAVGGNLSMSGFTVGAGLHETDTALSLVAGGSLTLSQGGVWGDTWYGTTYSADSNVVFHRGTLKRGAPVDFAARFSELRTLTSQLAGMTINGTTSREPWGGIILNGTHPTLNVFNVNASAFTGATTLSITAPANSLAVINIRGTSPSLSGFGVTFSGGLDQRTVLFNFPEATTINAQGIGFPGTVLAPYARMTFNNGSWDGGIYAVSLTGSAEGHINPLPDVDICQ